MLSCRNHNEFILKEDMTLIKKVILYSFLILLTLKILKFLIIPSEIKMISAIRAKLGTSIVIYLNKHFKLSGNSDLPAYVGLIVIKTPNFPFI